jgi:hypothetical protein
MIRPPIFTLREEALGSFPELESLLLADPEKEGKEAVECKWHRWIFPSPQNASDPIHRPGTGPWHW